MLPLLLSAIVFVCFTLGAVVFVLCAAVPFLRRYALSAALWCALWGPGIAGLVLATVAGLVSVAFIRQADLVDPLHWARFAELIGWGYLVAGCLGIAIVATTTAWFHHFLLQRLTLPLFRLYAAAVSAGIGSIFGWLIGFLLAAKGMHHILIFWIPTMFALMAGFGLRAYHGARSLRGPAPDTLTWITSAEFDNV